MKRNVIHRRGVTAIEVVVGVSIAALILLFVTHTIVRFVNAGRDVSEKTQALYLAEESLELIRYVRDQGWSNIGDLTNDTPYYLQITGGSVSITTTPEVIEDFNRSFVVSDVYRDSSSDDIVASTTGGSYADPESKYVTAKVTWGTPTSTVTLVTILTDISP